MDQKFDLISIGDSTVDVFLEVDTSDATAVCSVDKEKCLVCFGFGAKVPVRRMTRVSGVGNAANCAIGSSRLGLTVAIYTVIGSDQDSFEIKEVLEEEGVDTSFVVMENGSRSNFSAVVTYDGERTIFVYHEPRKYDLPDLPGARWVYFTSTGDGTELLCGQIVDYLKKHDAKLGFNPGSYHVRDGLDKLRAILAICDVVFLNREEAHMLVGGDIGDVGGLISSLKETGPRVVVVTDGSGGSFASFDGREVLHVGVPSVEVVERTGAGDAYSTGFLSSFMQEEDLPRAMMWGTLNSSSVIGYVGAREGLLTRGKMEEFVGKYGLFVKPRII